MYNITLIFTHHGDLGEKCNSDELYKIIKSINPEVIFWEFPAVLFDMLCKEEGHSNYTPETKTFKWLLQNSSIKHFPVDIDSNPNLSFDEIENTFKKYHVYKNLIDDIQNGIELDGYTFLNSKKCEKLYEEKKIMEKKFLRFIGFTGLIHMYKLFYEEVDDREYAIIKNIYNHSKENQYNHGVLIIGAAHRPSLKQKIKEHKTKEKLKLNWIFDHFEK
ncbi:MAG TPA: hypothetical protein VK492_08955 [Chitinophagaceae bacterium]|nr:hypothetical protein [Chitinophagaceae bacterium]